jgi:hypothetical protein
MISMAKILYCWKCKADVPMLTEDEWEVFMSTIERLNRTPFATKTAFEIPDWRAYHWEPAYRAVERMTGMSIGNRAAVWHHRLSRYGPPCTSCGKPLRTPRARLCAACGAAVTVSAQPSCKH